jgi:transcriptional regulator with XRE-family HTH domain
MDVLQRITDLRTERGWSLYKLADKSDIKQSTMTSWFRDGTEPKISTVEKLCGAFGIPLSQFFAGDDYMIDLTPEERELFAAYRLLNKEQRAGLLTLIMSIPDKK